MSQPPIASSPPQQPARPQRLDWIGPPSPCAPEDLLGPAFALRLQCFPDWSRYLDHLASRPFATALILAAPPPPEAHAFLDWFAQRGVLLGTTSPVLRAEPPEAAWLRLVRLLVTDAEPVGALALPRGSYLACIGGGVAPRLPEQCHAEAYADLSPVLRQHRLRVSAQQTIDHLSAPPVMSDSSRHPLAQQGAVSAPPLPAATPSVSIAIPRPSPRRRVGRLLRSLAARPGIGPILRWGWAFLRSGDTRQLVAVLERQQNHHQHEYQALLERLQQQTAQLQRLQTDQQQHQQALSERQQQQAEQLQQQQAAQQQQVMQLEQLQAEQQQHQHSLSEQLRQQGEQLHQHSEQLHQQGEQQRQQGEQLHQQGEQLRQQAAYLQDQRADLQAYHQHANEQIAPLRDALSQLHLPSGQLPALHVQPMADLLRNAREGIARENNPALFAEIDEANLRQLYLGELAGPERHANLRAQYQAYRPHLLPAQGPVLDVGCGMGDWLSYLAEQGERALGIDNNPYEVERCRQRGLLAECADGLDWLATQSNTYALITLMQVIEHIPRAQLDPLLAALAKALRPGGRLLLETLNPAHPLALSLFYNDPTHQRPLPVEYLSFLAQMAGLVPEQVLYTYPVEVVASAQSLQSPHYINYGLLLRKP
ncbi:MAG: class I SAM-dependent methyltransferase [Lamprobacter sp.]|uniref:class I SAM-dependent methyltransferase n=1 Tax=Lamprobacter sp. TaxID=3100796 RepID=UPI002B25BF29|nr:class I SAM-dependent methyltransferase [Lamprobacter sp.]MEA3638314.1 class I SAM-dependent methyltransferase [Lamprobacter sp.]